jgi:hypothetical protein
MNLAFALILVIAVIPSNTGAVAGVQASVEKTVGNSPENTNFLTGLSGIQEWASRLETALRNQGSKIDQSKAKDELLPRVIAIQKNLSDLEDINRRVVEDADKNPVTKNPVKPGDKPGKPGDRRKVHSLLRIRVGISGQTERSSRRESYHGSRPVWVTNSQFPNPALVPSLLFSKTTRIEPS